jgi:hypothetical protein
MTFPRDEKDGAGREGSLDAVEVRQRESLRHHPTARRARP